MFADNHLTRAGCEHRHQADFELLPTHCIPGNPDAVRSAEFGRAEVRAELRGGENEFAIGLPIRLLQRIVVAIDDQLPFDGNGLIFLIVKVEPPTEAAGWRFAGGVVHRGRPERDHARRDLERLFLLRLRLGIEQLLQPAGHRPAFGRTEVDAPCQSHQGEHCDAKRDLHGSHP